MCLSPDGKSVCFQELLDIYDDSFPEKCSHCYLCTSCNSLAVCSGLPQPPPPELGLGRPSGSGSACPQSSLTVH